MGPGWGRWEGGTRVSKGARDSALRFITRKGAEGEWEED